MNKPGKFLAATAAAIVLSYGGRAEAFIPPNMWEIVAMQVGGQWTYIIDPAGVTDFNGNLEFNAARLGPIPGQPEGLQGINITSSNLVGM